MKKQYWKFGSANFQKRYYMVCSYPTVNIDLISLVFSLIILNNFPKKSTLQNLPRLVFTCQKLLHILRHPPKLTPFPITSLNYCCFTISSLKSLHIVRYSEISSSQNSSLKVMLYNFLTFNFS